MNRSAEAAAAGRGVPRRAPSRWPARWRPSSLRAGVAWSATTVVAAWLLVLAAVAVLVVGVALGRAADDSLRARAQAVAATVVVAADGSVTQLESPGDQALDTDTWIIDGSGSLVEGAAPGSVEPGQVASAAGRVLASGSELIETVDADDPTRLLAVPVRSRTGSATAVVVTATSLVPYEQLQNLTVAGVGVLGVLLVLGVHLVLRAALSRALAPVGQMSALVQLWSTDDPGQRLGDGDRPLELQALAATLDALLDRISAALRHERMLTAELSHELRTPLAGMKAELHWLRAPERTAQERDEAHEDLDEVISRMERVIQELLASARSATAAPGRCSVADSVQRVVDGTRHVDVRQQVHVVVEVEPGLAAGVEAPVLERALSPLLDNALRYAVARIDVRARRVGGNVLVAVHDDGPGVPAHLVGDVLEPGVRGDPSENHPGAGLGLALSQRLAGTAGGELVITPAGDAGGGLVTLVLPIA